MLVLPERHKLVIGTTSYAQVLQAIPHARPLTLDVGPAVAVDHGPEEALVLKNMGFTVPEPIRYYYKWPGRFRPMSHQIDTAAFLTMNRKALCLSAPGTGKSLSALWAADYLLTTGAINRVLIVAPLSTVQVVWAREIYHHMPERSLSVLVGTRAKRLDLLADDAPYCIINHDGFTTIADDLTSFDLVIYDEGTALKTPGSQRFRVFSKWMAAHNPWLWILTGTPISQSPVDAWSLARLVGSPHVPKSYTAFKDKVMSKVTTFKWIPKHDALETCKQVLQPSIRFSLDDCVDLPQTNYVGRECALTPTQAKAFKEMQDYSLVMFKDKTVSAANAAVALGKLIQICGAVLYGEDKQRIVIDGGPRYDTLTELIDEIGDKVIIFCPLRGVQDWLLDKLTKQGYDVASVHGDVGKAQRNEIFSAFQNSDKYRILLAHPRVAAHGLTLTRAKDIIWYLPIYSLEQYEQANARIRRLNSAGKTTVWHLYSTKFEAELYRRLKTRQRVLGDFLNLVNGVNEDV